MPPISNLIETIWCLSQKISVVSFTFKQKRFETLHANALQWPLSRFNYVGVDPPASTGFDLQQASDGEQQNSLIP